MFKLLNLTIFLSVLTIGTTLPTQGLKKNTIVNRSRRMLNGTAVLIQEVPSQVGLLYMRNGILRYGGAGSIISNFWVVTVAHCTCWTAAGDDIMEYVSSGSNMYYNGSMHMIVETVCHPRYRFDRILQVTYNDIALVRVEHPFGAVPHSKPIGLFDKSWTLENAANAYGWGSIRRDGTGISTKLNMISVRIESHESCQRFLSFVTKSTKEIPGNLCAEGLAHSFICYGDSGGPLIQNKTLLGLISWIYSDECGISAYPGVFVDIRYYSDWIVETMRDLDAGFVVV